MKKTYFVGRLLGWITGRLSKVDSPQELGLTSQLKENWSVQKQTDRDPNARLGSLNIRWEKHFHPYESYRLEYADRYGEFSVREVALARTGTFEGKSYLGVYETGHFKTLRSDRVLKAEPLQTTHQSSIRSYLNYHTVLPTWPRENAVFKVPQTVGTRRWTVDLNAYSCTCPEKRVRMSMGYSLGTLGCVCSHLARAIVENLPEEAEWSPDLLAHMRDGESTSMGALV